MIPKRSVKEASYVGAMEAEDRNMNQDEALRRGKLHMGPSTMV